MIASNLNGAIASKLHMRANNWPSCITLGVFQCNFFLSWSVVIPNTSTEFFPVKMVSQALFSSFPKSLHPILSNV
jgi:hypothetical protein